MTGRVDFGLMFVLAAALHVAALGWLAPGGGSSGAGDDAQVRLMAASAQLVAQIADWEHEPEATVHVSSAPTPTAHPDGFSPKVSSATDTKPRLITPETLAPELRQPAPIVVTQPLDGMTAPSTFQLAELFPDSSDDTPRMAAGALRAPPAVSGLPQADAPLDHAPDVAASPRKRPDRNSEEAPPRVASGSGGDTQAGQARKPVSAGVDAAGRQRAQAIWAAAIQRSIARQQRYPRNAWESGRVKVQMTVLASGRLRAVGLAQSSGTAALDKAAILAVERAAPFPPAPKELTDDWFRVSQWITFERR